MRIVIGVNHFHPLVGGCEIVTQKIAEHLSANHEVIVFTRRVRERTRDKYPYRIVEYTQGDMRAFNSLLSLKPDIVFVYSDVFDLFRQITSRRNTFRLIVALCGANWIYANRSNGRLFNRSLNHIDTLICHSKCDRDYRLCSGSGISKKTTIIPNGVDVSEFDRNNLTRTDLAKDIANKRWVLNVSNFFPGKGQNHLVDILSRLPQENNLAYIQVSNDIEFDIGEKLEVLWRREVSRKLKSKMPVKLMKNISREQVVGFFKRSNVFAFTSEKEVAPLVLLECMAAKLPWISCDVGNATDLKGGKFICAIKNMRHYSVFDERVKGLFAKTLPKVWSSPFIGEEGRKQIEEEMNWEVILPQYSMVIEKCLS